MGWKKLYKLQKKKKVWMRFLEVETHLDFFGGWGLCGSFFSYRVALGAIQTSHLFALYCVVYLMLSNLGLAEVSAGQGVSLSQGYGNEKQSSWLLTLPPLTFAFSHAPRLGSTFLSPSVQFYLQNSKVNTYVVNFCQVWV